MGGGCWGERLSNMHIGSQGRICVVHCTGIEVADPAFGISACHSILTPGRPVRAMIRHRQVGSHYSTTLKVAGVTPPVTGTREGGGG